MNRRKLTYFITAAETLNLTETAEIHYIAQASISGSIAALEEELGCKLFDRSHRKLQLTPAGEYFYQASKRMLEIEDSFVHQTRYIASYQDHTIKIGTSYGFCFAAACQTLADFHQNFPEVHFQYDSMDNDSLIQQLKEKKLDIALSFHLKDLWAGSDYEEKVLQSCRYGVLVPEGHPLAQKKIIVPDDLKNEKVLYPTNYIDDVPASLINLNKSGIFPYKTLKANTVDQIIMTVQVERCLVLTAEFFITGIPTLFPSVFVPFQSDIPSIDLTIIKHKSNTRPAIKQLFNYMITHCSAK